ncbi:hypothetical protein SESBI_31052 [Sesbania bispinosa]|nr:hypothetical protein SESBI_31052 [Sesbania bispinosa]
MGKDDIISKALGVPNHLSRVRAAGFGASHPPCLCQASQPPCLCQASQPSMFVPGQPPSTPIASQPPTMPIATQTTPLMPTPGQSHPHEDGPPQPQPSIPPQSQKGSCTPIAFLEISEDDHPCFLFLNSPQRQVARGSVYNKGGVTLHTMSLPPGHHKVSVDVVQSHEEDSPLPVPIEDENLMTLRDAIGTYVAWPRSLINLPPRVPSPSSKGKGKEHFQTKECVTSPMKGSVYSIIPEEFAGAEGILAF